MRLQKILSPALLAIVLAAATVTGGGVSRAAEPVKIRAGWIATPASLLPIIFAKPGLAKHQGVTYQLEATRFNSSPTEITAVAAGEIEIGTLGFSSFPIAILNAGLTDLRIIADETQDGFQDYATSEYMVLNESPVKKVEDLKGKIVAVNGFGAGVDIGMRFHLMQHGLLNQRDYTSIEVPFPNMKAVLGDHKVDLMTGAAPFMYDPDLVKMARILFTLKDALHGSELSFWTMRAAFIEKHRAAVVDLLEDMIRSYRWYADPANHKEAVGYLAEFTKQPPERLDSWAFTKRDAYRDRSGVPDLAMLQRNVNAVKEVGFIKADVDVSRFGDLSLVKEAAQRLK